MSKRRRRNRVFWEPGKGWFYALNGQTRGPFLDSFTAGFEFEREKYTLRAVRRSQGKEPMTFADRRAEERATPYSMVRP